MIDEPGSTECTFSLLADHKDWQVIQTFKKINMDIYSSPEEHLSFLRTYVVMSKVYLPRNIFSFHVAKCH